MTGAVEVTRVASHRDDRLFTGFPYELYRGHAYWVPQLKRDARAAYDERKNPFYRHAEIERFLARRAGRVVGRIAAIVNRAHNEYYKDRVGFFGFYECVDDLDVARALLAATADFHRGRGMDTLRGPVNPSMGSECGLLIEGFDSTPVIMMPYNPEYYIGQLEDSGFAKEIDLFAFEAREDDADLQKGRRRLTALIERLKKRHPDLSIRPLELQHLRRDAFILRDIFDHARRENYGFVPSTDEEYEALVGKLKTIVDPALVHILEKDGVPQGCIVGLPDWNIALKKSEGAFGPLRLLKILSERKKLKAIRVIAVAVAPELQRSGVLAWLIHHVIERGLEQGYNWSELSWVAENNTVQMQTLGKLFRAEPYKRYRLYTLDLGAR